MPVLQPMDIILNRSASPTSWLIRVITDSPWSHAALIGEDGEWVYTTEFGLPVGKRMLGPGFSRVAAKDYIKGDYAIYRCPDLTPRQIKAGLEACRSLLGKPYDNVGLFAMLWLRLLGKGVTDDGTKDMKCSETVMWVYKQMGIALLDNTHERAGGVTPGELAFDRRLHEIYNTDFN